MSSLERSAVNMTNYRLYAKQDQLQNLRATSNQILKGTVFSQKPLILLFLT